MLIVLLLNGYPGVGKLTIARELAKILPDCKVFDNHLLIDAAAALYERSDKGYYPFRKQLRQSVFKSLSESFDHPSETTTQPRYIIFTENQSLDAAGRSVLEEYVTFVVESGFRLFHIILSCDLQCNIDRLASDERLDFDRKKLKTKLVDIDVLKSIRSSETIGPLYALKTDTLPNLTELELDISTQTPTENAEMIIKMVSRSVE